MFPTDVLKYMFNGYSYIPLARALTTLLRLSVYSMTVYGEMKQVGLSTHRVNYPCIPTFLSALDITVNNTTAFHFKNYI